MKDHSEHKMDETVFTAIAVAREAIYDRITKEEESTEERLEEEAFNAFEQDIEVILVKLALAVRVATYTSIGDELVTVKLNRLLKEGE